MFGKLKDKLKKTLSIFSKKTEEEAEEKQIGQVVDEHAETQEEPEEILEEKEEVAEEPIKKEPLEESRPIKIKITERPLEKRKEKPAEEKEENVITEPKKVKPEKVEDKKIIVKKEKEPIREKVEPIKQEPISTEKLIKETKDKFTPEEPEPEEIPKAGELIEKTKQAFPHGERVVEETQGERDSSDISVKPKCPSAEELIKEAETEEPTKELIREVKIEEPVEPVKKSFFGKIKQSLTTKTISAEKFEELFWDLELLLLENNVSLEVIEKIKKDLKTELVEKPLPRDVSKKIEETLQQTLTEVLSVKQINLLEMIKEKIGRPFVIAFFGINGAGKTTSIAKLAYLLQQDGLTTVLAAADTFRAAAIQQLEEHAEKLGTKMIKHDYGSDAAAVAFDAVKYAEKNKIDAVLIDTAGRLHSNTNLMDELKKIVRVTKPDLKIFVGESITGNDCIEQARKFNELVEIDAAILTKVDVDDKGGAPLSISYTIKKPILYFGVGQEYADLEKFDAQTILRRVGF